VLQLIADKHN